MDRDAHGRLVQHDTDRRRRPVEGFRLRGRGRFDRMVADQVAGLTGPVRTALAGASIVVEALPAPEEEALVTVVSDGVRVQQLRVHRRPLEVRALSRAELAELTREAIVDAVAEALGLDPDAP